MLSHFTSAVNTGQARQERQDTAIECLAQAWPHIEAETGQSSPIVAGNSSTSLPGNLLRDTANGIAMAVAVALATAIAMAIAIARARASFNDAKTSRAPVLASLPFFFAWCPLSHEAGRISAALQPELVGTVGPMAFCAKNIAALLEKSGLSRPRVKLWVRGGIPG